MTSKLNYGNVKEILEEICKKNGLHLYIYIVGYRKYRFEFLGPHIRENWIEVDSNGCPLTLCGFLECVKHHFEYHKLTKNNFDWSYYMKKAFTKADLKNGDVIKRRDGTVQIVCVDVGTCICQTGNHHDRLSDLRNDLTHDDNREGDIIAVRRPLQSKHCCFDAFDLELGELVYERSEPEEMTLEEVCKALGKEIKIVKG